MDASIEPPYYIALLSNLFDNLLEVNISTKGDCPNIYPDKLREIYNISYYFLTFYLVDLV